MKQRAKWLSVYLFIASLLQTCIYAALSWSPQKLGAIFYFDPRIGLFFIESGIRGAELRVPGILQWLSAICLLLISLLLLISRPILKTYIIFETIASIPNLFFFVVIALANLSPAHGFSIGELFIPVLVTMLFSLVPLIVAFRIWRERARQNLSIAALHSTSVAGDS